MHFFMRKNKQLNKLFARHIKQKIKRSCKTEGKTQAKNNKIMITYTLLIIVHIYLFDHIIQPIVMC